MNENNRRPRDRLGRPRSPVTIPGSNSGVPSKHKGRRRANAPLSPAQVNEVMNYWTAHGLIGVRNRAIIRLIYWEGVQIDKVLRLETDDWDRERNELRLPPRGNAPRTREGTKRKRVGLSESSRILLVAWWEARETQDQATPSSVRSWEADRSSLPHQPAFGNRCASARKTLDSLNRCPPRFCVLQDASTDLMAPQVSSKAVSWDISTKTYSSSLIPPHLPVGAGRRIYFVQGQRATRRQSGTSAVRPFLVSLSI
jgi:hypothetical protein